MRQLRRPMKKRRCHFGSNRSTIQMNNIVRSELIWEIWLLLGSLATAELFAADRSLHCRPNQPL